MFKKKNRKGWTLIWCSFNPIIEQTTFIPGHETLCNIISFYVQQSVYGMENFWKFSYGFMHSWWKQIGVQSSSENLSWNCKIILIQMLV
jgi:hypothetical protein